jgi:hypothetical protein
MKTSAQLAGQVAMTVHQGPYAELGAAHQAALDWCDETQRLTTLAANIDSMSPLRHPPTFSEQ